MPILIDERHAPLRLVVFDGPMSDGEFNRYLDAMSRWIIEPGTPGILLDASRASIPTSPQRKLQAAWMRSNQARLKELDAPTAFVITNAALRFVLAGIFALAPMAGPYKVVANRRAGVDFLQHILAGRGETVPDTVEELLDDDDLPPP